MTRTIAIVGAGPGVGLAIARKFGSEGYRVGLVARSQDKLDQFTASLSEAGIEAAGFAADATVPADIERAVRGIEERLGPIDVLEWSPTQSAALKQTPSEMTLENLTYQLTYTYGAIAATRAVLPGMIARGDGALLYTIGGSGRFPVFYSRASPGVAFAALRMYSRALSKELAGKGIYTCVMTVAGLVIPDTAITADGIAERLWGLVETRDRDEDVVGDVDAALEKWGN